MNIRQKIIKILEEVVPDGSYIDNNKLNLDSLQNVQFIVRLEEEFKISIPYEYLNPDHFKSIDKIEDIIKNSNC